MTAQAARLACVGSAIGVLGFVPVARLIHDRLYGVAPADPLTIGVAFVMLLLVSVAACVLPSARVARDTPMQAIREP